jgi:spore germination protein GerM
MIWFWQLRRPAFDQSVDRGSGNVMTILSLKPGRGPTALVAACLGVAAVAFAFGVADAIDTAGRGENPAAPVDTIADRTSVHLYFLDNKTLFLTAEDRVILQPDAGAGLGKQILAELIQGPRFDGVRTVPAGTRLRSFFVDDEGIAYVDLSEEISKNHPGGSRFELLTLYAIVNSLVLNLPEVKAVKVLVEGREADTLAGHIDIRHPFKADMLWIR